MPLPATSEVVCFSLSGPALLNGLCEADAAEPEQLVFVPLFKGWLPLSQPPKDNLVPPAGFEPATLDLGNRCSCPTELREHERRTIHTGGGVVFWIDGKRLPALRAPGLPPFAMVRATRLELVTFCVSSRRSNQLSYTRKIHLLIRYLFLRIKVFESPFTMDIPGQRLKKNVTSLISD